jgi:hypothetical protein
MKGPRARNRDTVSGFAAGTDPARLPARLAAPLMLALCALSACGPIGGLHGTSGGATTTSAAAPGETATVGPSIAPLPATAAAGPSPGETVKPIEKIAPIPTPMETFKSLTRGEGVQTTQLFTTPARDTDDRLKRLETAVQNMRNDLDSLMPTMVRMVTMEQSIKELVDQLRTLNGETAASETPDDADGDVMGPVQPSTQPSDNGAASGKEAFGPPANRTLPPSVAEAAAVAPAPAATQEPAAANAPQSLIQGITASGANKATAAMPEAQSAPAAPETPAPEASVPKAAASAGGSGGTLQGVRVADHGMQTRIVVDMSDKATLPVSLGANGSSLIVDPSGMGWNGQAQQALNSSKLVSGYKYENGRLVVALRKPAKIVTHSVLAPADGAGWRTVIDLALAP